MPLPIWERSYRFVDHGCSCGYRGQGRGRTLANRATPFFLRTDRRRQEPKFGTGEKRVKTRSGIGTQTLAAVALVVIIVVGAGAYFALSGPSSKSNRTTTSSIPEQSTSTTTSSSSTSSVTTSTTTTSSATSTSSTSQVTTQPSTSQAGFGFTMTANAAQAVLSPGDSTNYLVLTLTPYPSASGSETVFFNGTVSSGLGVSFAFKSLPLLAGSPLTDNIFLSASSSENVGNYTLTASATSQGQVQSTSIQVRVVQHLVYLSFFQFSPANFTVPKGSTVYFYNTDAPHNWCGESDSGDKTISFTSIVSTTSPTIASFSLWSITLAQGGTYSYMDTEHTTSGTGTIVVD